MIQCIGISIFLFFITSCGKEQEEVTISSKHVFIKGDPELLVAGTKAENQSFILEEDLNFFSSFSISEIYTFSEEKHFALSSSGQYVFSKEGFEKYEFSSNTKNSIQFKFQKNSSNALDLYAIRDSSQHIWRANPIHYSISSDKKHMSLLFTINASEVGKVLVSAVFYKNTIRRPNATPAPKVDEKYSYLGGKGKVTSWYLGTDKKIRVDICPSVLEGMQKQQEASVLSFVQYSSAKDRARKLVESSLMSWAAPFKAIKANFSISVNFLNECRPFSDVNEHSIHWIRGYLTYEAIEKMNYGITLAEFDPFTGEILSSDILMFESEINKMDKLEGKYSYSEVKIDETSRALMHEFGHFLGLGHKHEDLESIMSYNHVYELGTYDKEAILNLYFNQIDHKLDEINDAKDHSLGYKPLTD